MTPVAAARRYPAASLGLLGAAGLAWWWTVARMSGMDASPSLDLGTFGWFTASWTVMMAAMMLPSLAPILSAYLAGAPGQARGRAVLFACGYLLVWSGAGVLGYALCELVKAVVAGGVAWPGGGRWVSAGVLAAAAVYEFVPAKRACLARCRAWLGDRSAGAHDDWSAALATGVRSGCWCIGCSWALMAALFALGVMNLAWMALIAALVALEKAGRRPHAARMAVAVILAGLAVGILLAPSAVPGLVIPGSPAMPAMSTMH